jgi:drug/metabolite transporter (DMT)-like permease
MSSHGLKRFEKQRIVVNGSAYMLFAVALFAGMDALVKTLGNHYPTPQIVFCRSAFAFLPLAMAVRLNGGIVALRTERPGYHVARGLLGLFSMVAFFMALPRMRLADVIAISFSGPLFIAFLAGSVLGERIGAARWVAVFAGFGGVLLIVRPGTSVFDPISLLPLAGALSYSSIMLLVRRLGAREGVVATAFFFTVVTTIASAFVAPLVWVSPDVAGWLMLAGTGLAGGTANLCLTQAFRSTPVSDLAPLEYTSLLWGIALGYTFWGEIPDAVAAFGSAIIVASGLAVLPRSRSRAPVRA